MESSPAVRAVVIGGGAAGFFGALACAEAAPGSKVVVLEKGARFLSKVRVSGGGRCNVTHSCFEPRELAAHYPRGERTLIPAFHRFQPRDTIAWFAERGVKLKTEADGRMFPVTDSSETIINCFLSEARRLNVECRINAPVKSLRRAQAGHWEVLLASGECIPAERVLVATGGHRSENDLVAALDHHVESPVPSLFSFHLNAPWLTSLAGVSVSSAQASVPGTDLRESGPLLITHSGVSGPAILRLSAWGARELHARNYQFDLVISWVPGSTLENLTAQFQSLRSKSPTRNVANTPMFGLPVRLWETLLVQAGIAEGTQWTRLGRAERERLVALLLGTRLRVEGKSLNKEEFVTCGGVRLKEVDFRTMESRICPGLHFAGEALDIDGITGGFNFQAAWTTAWIAGRAMAGVSSRP